MVVFIRFHDGNFQNWVSEVSGSLTVFYRMPRDPVVTITVTVSSPSGHGSFQSYEDPDSGRTITQRDYFLDQMIITLPPVPQVSVASEPARSAAIPGQTVNFTVTITHLSGETPVNPLVQVFAKRAEIVLANPSGNPQPWTDYYGVLQGFEWQSLGLLSPGGALSLTFTGTLTSLAARRDYVPVYFKVDDWGQPGDIFSPVRETAIVVVTKLLVTGVVSDGQGHALKDVAVELFKETELIAATQSDASGRYELALPELDETKQYSVKVTLKDKIAAPANFEIFYSPNVQAGTGVYVKRFFTKDDVVDGSVTRDFDFGDPAEMTTDPDIPKQFLHDLATIYYHIKQAVDFAQNELGLNLAYHLPERIHAFAQDDAGWDVRDTAYHRSIPGDSYIVIGSHISLATVAGVAEENMPMNREWHEFGHHIMISEAYEGNPNMWHDHSNDPPNNLFQSQDRNHDGWRNPCTGDSLVEGWAEFYSAAIARWLGEPQWWVYRMWGQDPNLEQNHDVHRQEQREEFAVAGILVDLLDGESHADNDHVSLTPGQFWGIVRSLPADQRNVHGLYRALRDSGIADLLEDSDPLDRTASDLDELFVAHGGYADLNNNQRFDGLDVVGWMADGDRPTRQNTPVLAGGAVKVSLKDLSGVPLERGDVSIQTLFDPPHDYLNTSETTTLEGGTSDIYLNGVPGTNYSARIIIQALGVPGQMVLHNTAFWEANQQWKQQPQPQDDVIFQQTFQQVESTGTVTGRVSLQGRTSQWGAIVVTPEHRGTVTEQDGSFAIELAPGVYNFKVTMPGYLSATLPGAQVEAGKGTYLSDIVLLGGDIDGNMKIDIYDMVAVAAEFGSSPSEGTRADINGDGVVDIYDLALVGLNFGKKESP